MSEQLREEVERLCAAAEHDAALDGAATPLVSTYALRALLAATAPTPDEVRQADAEFILAENAAIDRAEFGTDIDGRASGGRERLSKDERFALALGVSTGCGCAPDGLCANCSIPYPAVVDSVECILAARTADKS